MSSSTKICSEEQRRFSHIARQVGPIVQARIDALKIGQKMQDLPEELWHESFRYYVKHDPNRRGGPNLRLIRLDPAKPSLTVTGYVFNKFVHPFENRFITPREAARLQGFPDWFHLKGTLTSVQRQIGNAVPVPLSLAVGRAIVNHALVHGTLKKYMKKKESIPSVSLFSGIGGLDLGLGEELLKESGIGFKPVGHIEFDDDCCETLSANFDIDTEPTDIASIASAKNYVMKKTRKRSVPIIIGGPPCQAFSQAGRQRAESDKRGQLVFEFIRFVEELKPVYFVMENVSNLKGVANGQLYKNIIHKFTSLGYHVSPYKLCAADYGTPQLRNRLLFIGVRNNYPPVNKPEITHFNIGNQEELFSSHLDPYLTVGEAFRGLPVLMDAPQVETKMAVALN